MKSQRIVKTHEDRSIWDCSNKKFAFRTEPTVINFMY